MAETTLNSASRKQVWREKWIQEYVRANQFASMTGKSDNMPIYVDTSLRAQGGEICNVGLRAKLSGAGVTGNTVLEGSEEELSNYNDLVTVEWYRNAVKLTKKERQANTELDLLDEAKPALKDWALDKDRAETIQTLESPVIGGLTAYSAATEVEKDAWLAANADRVLFGASSANNAANDHSASLANCDTAADLLTVANVRNAKALLKQCDPLIRPIQVDGMGEHYVAFCPSPAFRDLKNSLDSTHQNARERGMRNPLFQDGDLYSDGIIFKEVPEMSTLTGVGAASADCGIVAYLGAQAILAVWKQMPELYTDKDMDYYFRHGVSLTMARTFKKAFYNSVQHSVFTQYVAMTAI